MNLRILCTILLLIGQMLAMSQVKKTTGFINPTGSYKLDSKQEVKDGETYGNGGVINVKLINNSKLVMSLDINRGFPDYSSGSFTDTLTYINNIAIHTTPEEDTSCRIICKFSKKGILIEQHQANLNFGCGFGHGVFADGFYIKISSKVPKMDAEEK
jgi:hypothetical protein